MESETRKERMFNHLTTHLSPDFIEVIDVSNEHIGHVGASDSGETHYKITIRSGSFLEKSLVDSHRLVYSLLKEEFATGLHAVELDLKPKL